MARFAVSLEPGFVGACLGPCRSSAARRQYRQEVIAIHAAHDRSLAFCLVLRNASIYGLTGSSALPWRHKPAGATDHVRGFGVASYDAAARDHMPHASRVDGDVVVAAGAG
jgi:hypothetical protein